MDLWNSELEIKFFRDALDSFATPDQLFYNSGSGYFAYFPKGYRANGATLQSRNSLIGQFTERWSRRIFDDIASSLGLYAVSGVICEEIGLSKRSRADLAFCTSDSITQKAEDIRIIFEVKMSIISNYKFTNPDQIELIGDYKSHKGNPSLLRSDSMLKAIGKSVNIRVSSSNSASIPVIVLGNSPITNDYSQKVDLLTTSGILQGFWSLYPNPTTTEHIVQTKKSGFMTFNNYEEIAQKCKDLLNSDLHYFSSMIPKRYLGELIRICNNETTDEARGERFLEILRSI